MNQPKTNSARFPYLATVVAFIAIVIMLGLGFWQLDRKLEKERRLEQIDFAKQQQSLRLSDVIEDYREYQDFAIDAEGQLLPGSFYIDNKLYDGKAGFNVMRGFETDSGILMLDLGWLAATAPRPAMPEYKELSFKAISGVLYIPTDNQLITETNQQFGSFPALLQQAELSQFERHLGQKVLPFILRTQQNDNPQFVRKWEAVTMSPEKHLGYAIQWFGLAVAGLTVYLLSILKWMQAKQTKTTNKNDHGKS